MKNITIAMTYKRLLLLVSLSLFLVACGKTSEAYMSAAEVNGEIVGAEKDDLVNEVSESIFDTIEQKKKLEEPLEIGNIEKSGLDLQLPTGRYLIRGSISGNLYIRDAEGKLVLKTLFDPYYGVEKVTLDIREDDTLFFDGGLTGAVIENAPAREVPVKGLSAGIWKVGKHIAPGSYDVSVDQTYGYVYLHEKGKEVRVFELLGRDLTKTVSEIELEEGQVLILDKADYFHFTVQE